MKNPKFIISLLIVGISGLGSLSFSIGMIQAGLGKSTATARLLEGYLAIAIQVLMTNFDIKPNAISPFVNKITQTIAVLALLSSWFFVDNFNKNDALIKDESTNVVWSSGLVCLAGFSSNISFLLGWCDFLRTTISAKPAEPAQNNHELESSPSSFMP